jgi:hypothetical protein
LSNKKTRSERKQLKFKKNQLKLIKRQEKLENAGRFKRWRNHRPFWGAVISTLAGLLILYIPVQLYAIAFVPGSFAFIGFLFGGLVLIMGVLSFIYPQFSTILGIITIFLSILSIVGALGGFLFGTILGIIGGALCIGYEKQAVSSNTSDSGKVDQPQEHEKIRVIDEIVSKKSVAATKERRIIDDIVSKG